MSRSSEAGRQGKQTDTLPMPIPEAGPSLTHEQGTEWAQPKPLSPTAEQNPAHRVKFIFLKSPIAAAWLLPPIAIDEGSSDQTERLS